MRSQKMLLIWGLVAILGLTGLFVGCSDDDGNTPTGDIGSLNDPEFVVVRDVIESVLDSTMAYVSGGLSSEGRIPADDSTIVDAFYGPNVPNGMNADATYEYINGWHILTLLSSTTEFNASYKDSVRFLDAAGNPMQNVSNPNSINFRRHWDHTPTDTNVTHARYNGHARLDFANVHTNLGRINGQSGLHIVSKLATSDSVVIRDITINADLNNIDIVISPIPALTGCPDSGTISATLDMIRQKGNQDPVTTTWEITVEFTPDEVTVVVIQGTTTWTFTSDVCL